MLTGGKPNDNGGRGLFYEPTVLVDVDHEMDCMREETFGPTLPVMKGRDAAEAIEKANDSRFGFVGQRLDARQDQGDGAGPADEHRNSQHQQRAHGHLPVPGPDGGWKESDVGSRSGGAEGIRKYCRTKSIVAERIVMKKEPIWYPYSRTKGKIVSAAGRFLGARDWRRRLGR